MATEWNIHKLLERYQSVVEEGGIRLTDRQSLEVLRVAKLALTLSVDSCHSNLVRRVGLQSRQHHRRCRWTGRRVHVIWKYWLWWCSNKEICHISELCFILVERKRIYLYKDITESTQARSLLKSVCIHQQWFVLFIHRESRIRFTAEFQSKQQQRQSINTDKSEELSEDYLYAAQR